MKEKRIAFNVIITFLNRVLLVIVPLITTPYISRIFGPENVGIYSFYGTIVAYFVLFAMLGVSDYGNRSISMANAIKKDCVNSLGEPCVNKEERSREFWGIYIMQVIATTIALVIYVVFALVFAENKTMAWIMIITLLAAGLDISWYVNGVEKFVVQVTANVILKIVNVVCIFVFIKGPEDLALYAIIICAGTLFTNVFLWLCVGKTISKVKIKKADVVKHIRPNLILFIPVIAVSLYRYMDKVMLGLMTSEVEVGFYASCETIVHFPIALVNAVGTVLMARISNMISTSDKDVKEQVDDITQKSMSITMFAICAMSFGIMAVSKEFVPLFYGDGFDKCIVLLLVLLPSLLFMAFSNVIRTQYLMPYKKDKEFIISIIVGAVVNLVLNSILIPFYASVGAAIATLCAEIAVCVLQIIFVRKYLPIKKYLVKSIPFVLIGMAMFGLLQLPIFNISIQWLNMVVKIAVGAIIYLGLSAIVFFIEKKLNGKKIQNS